MHGTIAVLFVLWVSGTATACAVSAFIDILLVLVIIVICAMPGRRTLQPGL